MDMAIDAIAQRYSISPLEAEKLNIKWFYLANTLINAENTVTKREAQKNKAKARIKR